MKTPFISIPFVFTAIIFLLSETVIAQDSDGQPIKSLLVKKCADFVITGSGDNREWSKTEWNVLSKLDTTGGNYESKFKILYSNEGIYVLCYGSDTKITTAYTHDFENLFEGDVFEVFFHTDSSQPLYLEYEVNQLNKELVLLIPHLKESFYGWIPFHYENDRRMKKAVIVNGGKMEAGANIRSWTAELFFPYKLFNPLENVPPKSGAAWNANFYRLDYDSGKMAKWSWAPVKNSFHEYEKFWPIKFE